jgi:hypothetical protein
MASDDEAEDIRARARLPHLGIEIVHRRPKDGGAEMTHITLRAVPSFAAFVRFLEATNPLAWWTAAVQAAWAPWLGGGGFGAALGARERPRPIGEERWADACACPSARPSRCGHGRPPRRDLGRSRAALQSEVGLRTRGTA